MCEVFEWEKGFYYDERLIYKRKEEESMFDSKKQLNAKAKWHQ